MFGTLIAPMLMWLDCILHNSQLIEWSIPDVLQCMNEPMTSMLPPKKSNWQIIYFTRTINNFLESDYALVDLFDMNMTLCSRICLENVYAITLRTEFYISHFWGLGGV